MFNLSFITRIRVYLKALPGRVADGEETKKGSTKEPGDCSAERGRRHFQETTSSVNSRDVGKVPQIHSPLAQHPRLSNAKLRQNFQKVKSHTNRFVNSGYLFKDKPNTPDEIVRRLAGAMGFNKSQTSNSFYGEFETDITVGDRKCKLRLSTHPANGEYMSAGDFDIRISMVIYKNGAHKTDGTALWDEYIFYPDKTAYQEIARQIADGVLRITDGLDFDDGNLSAVHRCYAIPGWI